jgi:hypothetical protein
MMGLPAELPRKLLPSAGGVSLSPVVQTIVVAVTRVMAQVMPSITMETALVEVAKLLPVMLMDVPPVLGPKEGLMPVMTDVEAVEYVIKLLNVFEAPPKRLTETGQGRVELYA